MDKQKEKQFIKDMQNNEIKTEDLIKKYNVENKKGLFQLWDKLQRKHKDIIKSNTTEKELKQMKTQLNKSMDLLK